MTLADFLHLTVTVIGVSVSGVLFPGPLFFATLSEGSKRGSLAGVEVSLGHALVELPLILFMTFGLTFLVDTSTLSSVLGVAGGVVLVLLGGYQTWKAEEATDLDSESDTAFQNPVLMGVYLTILNPFFVVWWLTVGLKLVVDAYALAAFLGVLYMFSSHIWMDFAWLYFTAFSAFKGRKVIGSYTYVRVLQGLGVVLALFGIYFIASSGIA